MVGEQILQQGKYKWSGGPEEENFFVMVKLLISVDVGYTVLETNEPAMQVEKKSVNYTGNEINDLPGGRLIYHSAVTL